MEIRIYKERRFIVLLGTFHYLGISVALHGLIWRSIEIHVQVYPEESAINERISPKKEILFIIVLTSSSSSLSYSI